MINERFDTPRPPQPESFDPIALQKLTFHPDDLVGWERVIEQAHSAEDLHTINLRLARLAGEALLDNKTATNTNSDKIREFREQRKERLAITALQELWDQYKDRLDFNTNEPLQAATAAEYKKATAKSQPCLYIPVFEITNELIDQGIAIVDDFELDADNKIGERFMQLVNTTREQMLVQARAYCTTLDASA